MKLFSIVEVGRTIAHYDQQGNEGEMDSQAVRAINSAVDALGDDLSPENILAWIRMRYDSDDLGFHRAVERVLDRESDTTPAEENEDHDWDRDERVFDPQDHTHKADPEDTEWDAHHAREDGDDERADDLEWDAEFARQDAEEEESSLAIQLGDHNIKLLGGGRDKNPFGNNPIAVIEFDGTKHEVYKQGMINIWAFKERSKLSNEEGKEFDKWMDSNYELAPKL